MSSLQFKSIAEKEAEIIADIESKTGQSIPTGDVQFDRINARSISGMSKETEMSIVVAARDVFLSKTQDDDVLNEYALYTKTTKKTETPAKLNITAVGTPFATIVGGISGTTYISEFGLKYYFESDFVVPAGGNISQIITCMTPGIDGNLSSGTLSITAQSSDISDTATIASISVEGTQGDTREQFRSAIIKQAQRPPIPDTASYYNYQARRRPNVVAAYMYADKPGQVTIYIETDSSDGIATPAQCVDMLAWFKGDIDGIPKLNPGLMGVLPDGATERFAVLPSARTNFNVSISGVTGGGANINTVLTTAVQDWFKLRKPYIKGVSIENTGIIDRNGIRALVQGELSNAGSGVFDDVTFSLTSGGGNITSYALGRGERSNALNVYVSE